MSTNSIKAASPYALPLPLPTSIKQPIRTQDVVSDLHALRPDWLLHASGNDDVNGDAWCNTALIT